MAYKVGPKRSFERKNLVEGKHFATIKLANIRETKPEHISPELKELGVVPKQISIMLVTDTDESGFDTIYQNLNQDTFELEFQQWKQDLYSHAVGIPEGTTFSSIEEWLNFLVDKRIFIEVEIKENGYPRIAKIMSVEEGMEF